MRPALLVAKASDVSGEYFYGVTIHPEDNPDADNAYLVRIRTVTMYPRRMPEPNLADLANAVRSNREAVELSIADAAAEAGIDPATWLAIEAGKYDADYLQMVAIGRTLMVPVHALLTTETR